MNTANKITFLRVWLSPVFFVLFFLPVWTSFPVYVAIPLMVVTFAAIELSDLFDGKVARRLNQVSDFGKALDPFGDSISRITYFFCFTVSGYMPAWIFILILYRDMSVSFIRQLAAQKGTVMPSRMSGKIKAWVYAVAGIVGTLYHFGVLLGAGTFVPFLSLTSLGMFIWVFAIIMNTLFFLASATAVWTLADYLLALRKN